MWHLAQVDNPLSALCGRPVNTTEGGWYVLCKTCVFIASPPEVRA
jgi:hypothetical protein